MRWRWLLIGCVLALFFAFFAFELHHYLSWDYVRSHLDTWQAWVDEHHALALVGLFVTYVTAAALSLPIATILTLIAGAMFGRWLGCGIVLLAASTGATLAMLGSRYLFRDYVHRRFGSALEAIDRGVTKDGAFYLFSLRLAPYVPFVLINLAMGLTSLHAVTFFVVSIVGMAPATFLYVNAGRTLATLESPLGILSPIVLISFAALGLMPLVLRWVLRRTTPRDHSTKPEA